MDFGSVAGEENAVFIILFYQKIAYLAIFGRM